MEQVVSGSGISGMDVAGVRQLAQRLQESATRMHDLVARIDGQVARSSWHGRDSEQFRGSWWPAHRRQLLATAEGLAGLGRSAANNADAQERTSSTAGSGSGAVAVTGSGNVPGSPHSAASGLAEFNLQESWQGEHRSSVKGVVGLQGPFGRVFGELHTVASAAAHRDLQVRADGRGLLFHHDVGFDASAETGGSLTRYVGPVVLEDSLVAKAGAEGSSSSTFQLGNDGVRLADRIGAEASVDVSRTTAVSWGSASMSTTAAAEASARALLERDVHADGSGVGFTLNGALEAGADLQYKRTFQLSGLTISQGAGYGAGLGGHAGASGNIGPVTSFSANAGLWFMEGLSGEQTVSIDWDRVGHDIAPLTEGARGQWDAAWERVLR